MTKYTYEITIEANNEIEAIEKLKSASLLMQKLRSHEIKKLADVVKNDPVKTAFAKKALGL